MNDKTLELGTKGVGQLLFIYALPAVISQIISSLYNIVDRIFIGQGVGPLAIAGLAITMPIMNVIHAFGSLVGAGAGARMSIVLGMNDKAWAERILFNSLYLTFIFGALFLGVGYACLDNILEMFGATAQTISYAREYMQIVLPGMFMTTLAFNLAGQMRSSGYPIKSMFVLGGGAILNIALDAIFIFGFDMGIRGAALATTISMALTALVTVLHFTSRKSFIRIRRHAWRPRLYIWRNIILIGISPFSIHITSAAVVALANTQLLAYGGDYAVGANGIVNSYAGFLVLLILGICQGMQPIAGYNYGAGKSDRLWQVYRLAAVITTAIGLFGAVIGMLIPGAMMRVFTSDGTMISIGVTATRYIMVLFPLVGFTICNSNFFQSIDKPWIAIVNSLSRQLIFLAPFLWLFPKLWGDMGGEPLSGIWAAFTTSDFCGFVLAVVLLYTQRSVFRQKSIEL